MNEIAAGEIHHIETVAQLYLEQNSPIPEFEKVLIRSSDFSGGKRNHEIEQWPQQAFFDNKRKLDLVNYRITRLDWGLSDTAIDSIRFTMSNGDVSPKFGRKAISHTCEVDSKITKVTVMTKDNRVVSLAFDTEAEAEFLKIQAPIAQSGVLKSIEHTMSPGESLVGFKMRIARSALQGLSCQWLSSSAVMQQRMIAGNEAS